MAHLCAMSPSGGGSLMTLALLLFLGGCRIGTDLPGDMPAELMPVEAIEVSAQLLDLTLANSVFSSNHVGFAHTHNGLAAHVHPISGPFVHELQLRETPLLSHNNFFQFDLVLDSPCESGGTVQTEAAISGEGNPAIQPGAVHYVIVQTHSDCALILAESGSTRLVIDAAPYLTIEAHATNDVASSEVYGTIVGGLAWEAETKAGTCELDLAYSGAGPTLEEVAEITLTGTFCDLEIETTLSR